MADRNSPAEAKGSLSRRTLLTVSTGSVGFSSGCLSTLDDGTISLSVLNWSDTTRVVSIAASKQDSIDVFGSNGTDFQTEIEIEPTDSVRIEDAFDGGEYEVTVSLDTGISKSHTVTMNNCQEQNVNIRIRDEELVEFSSGEC